MNRMRNLLVHGSVALLSAALIAPISQAQVSGNNQPSLLTKELAAAAPMKTAPAKNIDSPNSSVFQYLTILTSDGWTVIWSFAGPFRVDQNLSNVISPDLLQEYRCRAQAKQILQRGQRKITIDAFQFATADGAYGAYCAGRRGSSSYATQGDASSEDQNSISFCKDQYFICLQSSELDDDEAKSAINKLAQKLIEHIEMVKNPKQSQIANPGGGAGQLIVSSSKPEIFNYMPTMERVRGSEKLVMGPAGMKRFFPAPYSANLAPLLKGAVADFKLEEPHRDRLKLLIACYPTAAEANMTYAKYTGTLSSEHDEKSVEGFTYSTALFKVSDCWLLCQLRDKQIIVINGARHKDTLGALAHQIYL